MKQTPRGIRLDPDVQTEVQKIAEVTGLPQTEVIRQLIRAGARAVKDNGYKLHLPLGFKIEEADPSVRREGFTTSSSSNYPPHRQEVTKVEDKPAKKPKAA